VDLSQSPAVRLVSAARIADGLRRMRGDPGARLTPALASEVAQREGVKAVVTGAIDPVGKGYVLVASVVSAGDGATLASVRETATDETALIPALDRLSHALRERIGESLTTIRANEPLEQVTTPSLEALQRYTAAVRAENAGDYETAVAQLERATALDTGFAMAYRKLAAMLSNVSGSTGQMVAAATHAFVHRDRLPPLERDQTTAYYYWTVDYQPTQAAAAYHDVLARDPNDYIALNNLALLLQRQRQWSAAESLALRGIATGRCGSVCYLNLVIDQAFQGRYDDARASIDRFAAAVPGDPMVLGLEGELAIERGDYATAERLTRQMRDQQAGSPFWREQTSNVLAGLALLRGHLAVTEQHAREVMAAAEQRGLHDHYLTTALNLGLVDGMYRNRRADGLNDVSQALARYPLASIPPLDRPYIELARFYVRLGHPDDARRLLGEYERVVPAGLRNGQFGRHAAAADLALADGRLPAALAGYRAWREESGCDVCGLFEEAEVFERAGQPDSALARYERLATLRVPFRLYTDAYFLAATYKRLGELYETRRDRAKAIDAYAHFVDLWKTADPELQPVVKDVRARIARLSAERY
jgi:tetratricopeptide (TPR) repeat protein